MRLARAEERRQGVNAVRSEVAKQLAAREVESRYELDVIRFKKQQLREIKRLLAKGGSDDDGGGEAGLSDGGGEGSLGLLGVRGHGADQPDHPSQQQQRSSPVGLAPQPPAHPAGPIDAPAPRPPA